MAIMNNIAQLARRMLSKSFGGSTLLNLMLGAESNAGIVVTPESAMRCATVYACASIISRSLAQLPFRVQEQTGKYLKDRPDHPVARAFRFRPNSYQTPFEFVQFLSLCQTLRGNSYSKVFRSSSGALDLFHVHPDRVEEIDLVKGKLLFVVKEQDGSTSKIQHKDMLFVPALSTDGVKGKAVVECARESIGLAMATESHGSRLFKNNAQPGGTIEVPFQMKKEEAEEFRKSVQESTSRENVGRPLLLQKGIKWTRMGLSNDDAQFLETRQFQVKEICAIFGVPPYMVTGSDKAFTNIEQQSLEFWNGRILPDAIRIEQAIRRTLIPESEWETIKARWNFEGVLRADTTARHAAHQKGVLTGYLTRNEVREIEGLNPLPGLDAPLQPLNMGAV